MMDDCESSEETASAADNLHETVSFNHVSAVATGWMLDFMFVTLCRRFKEGKLEEFNETLSTFQAISQSSSFKENLHDEKMLICALLARIMYGKDLDVLFEEDESVMPLMSAFKVWSKLEHTVTDESLFRNVYTLLVVQSVAVCLEKGQKSSASSALNWFEKHDAPQKLQVKLSTIVTQRETYHPFLMSFSFNRLLETVQSFLDTYLEKNPSDYLLKAATNMVESCNNFELLENVMSEEVSLTEEQNKQDGKTKRRLLSTKITDVWKPETAKKPFVSVKRLTKTDMSQFSKRSSPDRTRDYRISALSQAISRKSLETTIEQKPRKRPRKWTPKLDLYLKKGVMCHGQGKWSKILLDYDFEGRSSTMLKDRWRVLTRRLEVG